MPGGGIYSAVEPWAETWSHQQICGKRNTGWMTMTGMIRHPDAQKPPHCGGVAELMGDRPILRDRRRNRSVRVAALRRLLLPFVLPLQLIFDVAFDGHQFEKSL